MLGPACRGQGESRGNGARAGDLLLNSSELVCRIRSFDKRLYGRAEMYKTFHDKKDGCIECDKLKHAD